MAQGLTFATSTTPAERRDRLARRLRQLVLAAVVGWFAWSFSQVGEDDTPREPGSSIRSEEPRAAESAPGATRPR